MTDHIGESVLLDAPAPVVERFLYALQDKDLATADAVLDDDVVYQNVGTPATRGRGRVMTLMRALERSGIGFEVKMHRIAAEGGAVLTERTDALTYGKFRAVFWVCGTFEVHDGRITLWRDYFDFVNFTVAIVRGLVGIVVPPLRPRPLSRL